MQLLRQLNLKLKVFDFIPNSNVKKAYQQITKDWPIDSIEINIESDNTYDFEYRDQPICRCTKRFSNIFIY